MEFKAIGIINSPYKERKDAPCQGFLSDELIKLEIYDEYIDGLKAIENNKKIIVLYWADRADRSILQTKMPFGSEIKGVFASRSPARPNPICVCEAELININDNILTVKGVEALDGSPLLDIKSLINRELQTT